VELIQTFQGSGAGSDQPGLPGYYFVGSQQVIGYNGSSKHMGLCWAWLATYLKSIIVFDAWLMPDDVSKAEQTDKNNKYYVYVYNMQVDARQNLAIPLL
jgi:hypothetical protein